MPVCQSPILSIDPKETRRYAGLRKAPEFSETLIQDACDDALLLITPKGIYQCYDYDWKTQMISADPPLKIESVQLGKHLAICDKVIVLSATVGEDIENEATSRFERGEYTAGLLLDAAAATAVEQLADSMEKIIAREYKAKGYEMRWRFSPGYGDWAIENQPELIRLTKANEIGVGLSDSLMLMPRKSITAIIGLYKEDRADLEAIEIARASKTIAKGCATCSNLKCPGRDPMRGTCEPTL